MPVYHNLTATTPDDPKFEIRPSHWNDSHSLALSGSEVIGAFSNAGNVSFAVETNGFITASANVTAAASPVNVTAGTTSGNLQTIAFSNSNGVSFGLNGSTITASHNGLTTAALSNHSHGNPTLNLTNLSGTTGSNSAGFTLSLSAAAQTVQPVAVSANNGSYAFSTLSFSNANGISFGTSAGSAITASHNALTTARASNDAIGLNTAGSNVTWTANSSGLSIDARGYAGTATAVTGNASLTVNSAGVSFNGSNLAGVGTSVTGGAAVTLNSNGLQFNGASLAGTSSGFTGANISATITHNTAGLALSMSVAGAGGAASQTLYATGNTTVNSSGTMPLSSLLLRGYGIVSLGTSNGSILVSSPDPSTLAPSWYAVGNTTGASSSSTIPVDTISVQGAGGVSVGYSNGSLVISGGAGGGVTPVVSANNGSYSFTTLSFSNANGVSFGTSAGSAITASYTVPTQTNQTLGGYFVGNTTGQSSSSTVDARSLSVDGAGIVSAGWSAGSIRISATQSNQAASAANGSFAFQTVNFSNANGVSFVTSAGSAIAASVETSYAASNHSHGNPTLALTNLSGTTASNSAGLTLSLSAAAPGGGVTPAVSAANGSYSFSTLSLSNANGISFGTSAGSAVTASYTVPSVTQYFSATNTTFNGANISGSMTLNTNGLQLSMSVAAPGAAAENNAIALLGANTAGNTTATGSTIGWSGVNLTLSGTNASQVVISAPATSSLSATGQLSISTNGSTISIGVPAYTTLSQYQEAAIDREWIAGQIGNNQLFVQPMALRAHYQFEEIACPGVYTAATNSSGSATMTLQVGIYTRNASTLSLITSASQSFAVTNSGTVGSYSIYGGLREFPVPLTTTLSPGNYFIGFLSRTTTGGAAGMTWSNVVASNINSAYSGRWSSANNATNQYFMGMGSFNTTTTALPNSFGISAINGSAAVNLRPVVYKLVSQDLN